MKGYLYVVDESGQEIAGSRRYLGYCETLDDLGRVRAELESKAGENCLVLDSEVDRRDA